jgi:hypothetical protein
VHRPTVRLRPGSDRVNSVGPPGMLDAEHPFG